MPKIVNCHTTDIRTATPDEVTTHCGSTTGVAQPGVGGKHWNTPPSSQFTNWRRSSPCSHEHVVNPIISQSNPGYALTPIFSWCFFLATTRTSKCTSQWQRSHSHTGCQLSRWQRTACLTYFFNSHLRPLRHYSDLNWEGMNLLRPQSGLPVCG